MKTLSLRIPDDLHAELAALAHESLRSTNSEIVTRLRASLAVHPVTLAQAAAAEMRELSEGALEDPQGAAQAVMALAERGGGSGEGSSPRSASARALPEHRADPKDKASMEKAPREKKARGMCEHRVALGSYCKRCETNG